MVKDAQIHWEPALLIQEQQLLALLTSDQMEIAKEHRQLLPHAKLELVRMHQPPPIQMLLVLLS